MKICMNCNVHILDETSVCPLCRQVLLKNEVEQEFTGAVYPDLSNQNHVERLIGNIVLFISLVGEAMLVTFELMGDSTFHWGILVGLGLLYINVILRMTIIGKSSYLFRLTSAVIFSLAVLGCFDFLTGHKGWSVEFVFPAGMLLFNLCIGILMIVNRRNWQSYMMLQILAILLSLIPLILLLTGVVHFPYLIVSAFSISCFYFMGTLIIGDYRARTELKRRFHI